MSGLRVERDEASALFFEASARGRLLIRRCPGCDAAYPPWQRHCTDGEELEWQEASGAATLVSWAVEHAPPLDESLAGPDGVTSMFALVELEEGPWMQVPLVDIESGLAAGSSLRVTFIRPGGGEAIPAFTLP